MSGADALVSGLSASAFGPNGAVPLYRAEGSRALDALAIQEFGVPGITLMERAGRHAFGAFRRRWPARCRLAVVCGPGNNGGDGFVVARLAAEAGFKVEIFTLQADPRPRGDAGLALERACAAGLRARVAREMEPRCFDAVVDGLFGTGLARELAGEAAGCVERINAVAGPCMALDVPSGLNADTGRVLGCCVRARITVTFIARKPGLYTGQAADHVGELCFASLDVPFDPAARRPPDGWQLAFRDLQPVLGARRGSDHKGRFGRAVLIGGERGFAGAVRMAGEAAARCGAGLTSVATRPENVTAVLVGRPELMVRGVERGSDLEPLLGDARVLGIGPGLGTGEWGRELLAQVLDADAAVVLDADALNLLAADGHLGQRVVEHRAPVLLTPHPGEAARLLSCTVAEVEADRFTAAARISQAYSAVVLLKGAGTVVQVPGHSSVVCVGGHPAMASGGMGDVLTGVLCGLAAQGMSLAAAAVRGTLLHATAAERARAVDGLERGLLATDLMGELPRLARWL